LHIKYHLVNYVVHLETTSWAFVQFPGAEKNARDVQTCICMWCFFITSRQC